MEILVISTADLHIHTNFSDGTETPEQIVEQAAKLGIKTIAITDHDTVDGIERAITSGKKNSVDIIAGVELSADYDDTEIHILGYFVDHTNSIFCNLLDMLKEQRTERLHKMIHKLKELNVFVDDEEVFDVVGVGAPGRLHLAEVICKNGYTENIYECFDNYIGYEGPAYVHKKRITASDAIWQIQNAGGVAVLAHPYKVYENLPILELIKIGIQGIEIIYPTKQVTLQAQYTRLAKANDLAITGGTDYHGARKPGIKLGDITIENELVINLKKKRINA